MSMRLRSLLMVALAGSSLALPYADAATPTAIGSPKQDCRAMVAQLDLQTATIADLQRALKSGKLTSRQLVQAYLGRIKAYDGTTNSVRELSPTALAYADSLDAERLAG